MSFTFLHLLGFLLEAYAWQCIALTAVSSLAMNIWGNQRIYASASSATSQGFAILVYAQCLLVLMNVTSADLYMLLRFVYPKNDLPSIIYVHVIMIR